MRWVLASAAAVLLVAACSSGGDSGCDCGEGTPGRLTPMLAVLPDTGDARGLVRLSDLEKAAALLEIEVPESDDTDGIAGYREALTGPSTNLLAPPVAPMFEEETPGEARAELGFALEDVTSIAEVGDRPGSVTVLTGEFDADAIDEATAADPEWDPLLETDQRGDTRIWRWGEDAEVRPDLASPGHPGGASTRLALTDDRLVRTFVDELMAVTLDVLDGVGPSLASVGALVELTEALDERGAVSAMLTDDVDGLTLDALTGGELETPPGITPLLPYEAFATGTTRRDASPVLLLAFIHADAEAAATNADRLEANVEQGAAVTTGGPWSELLSSVTVELEGPLLVLEARPESAEIWSDLAVTPETLLVHE